MVKFASGDELPLDAEKHATGARSNRRGVRRITIL
jgi:hypothetical protein